MSAQAGTFYIGVMNVRKDRCKDCLCNSCMQNAEDYADGMCRECECCREDGMIDEAQMCRDYESDDNPINLM